ncbi:MAG: TolC family protein [Thermoguttaceae bacterium]|nr:TolC family protein [Thermoguttaceae bacterium]
MAQRIGFFAALLVASGAFPGLDAQASAASDAPFPLERAPSPAPVAASPAPVPFPSAYAPTLAQTPLSVPPAPAPTASPAVPSAATSGLPGGAPTDLPTLSFASAPGIQNRVSIASLQEKAIQNHPSRKLADSLVEAERGAALQSSLRPNPSLRYDAEEIGADGSAGKQGVALEQTFGGASKRQLSARRHSRALETLDWNKRIAIAKIRADVRELAYRLVASRKKLEFRRGLLEISRATEERARAAVAAGSVEITRLEFLQLQNQTRLAQTALGAETNRAESLEKRLAALVGEPSAPIGEVADDPNELANRWLDENAVLETILNESPQVAKKNSEIAEKQAALAYETEPNREFSLEGGVSYDFADKTTLAKFGVGIPLRVNDRNQGNIAKASAELRAARDELDRLRIKLRSELAETLAEYKTSREEVLAYRQEIVPDFERAFSISRRAYENGQINFIELSVARASYVESVVGYLDALERLAASVVRIESSLLEKSLEDE